VADPASVRLAPWNRLSVRLAALFAVVTLLAVGAVGALVYERQKREIEETLGTQLLNIARTAALLVDPGLHAEAQRAPAAASPAHERVRAALAAVQREVLVPTPLVTLSDFDPARRQARRVVTSDGSGRAGEPYPLAPAVIEAPSTRK
jgi:hypothetical protein